MISRKYRPSDLVHLLRTPLGRIQFWNGVYYRLWPLLSRLARIYRRAYVSRTRVVAVVGSFGKTTTTRMVNAILKAAGHRTAMVMSDGPNRVTWTPHEDGSVQQVWETSTDGGETWTTVFDGQYVKARQE